MKKIDAKKPFSDDLPPAPFKSWRQMYVFVLTFHTLLIMAFYAFMRAYS